MNDEKIKNMAYISISKNRKKVLSSFVDDNCLTAKEISERTGISKQLVSATLGELRKKGYVYAITPTFNRWFYRLTPKGEEVVEFLKNNNKNNKKIVKKNKKK